MRLILVRHGETRENVKGICQGHLPGHLTSKGISQAKKVAKRLKDENIDVIYSSDLKRAKDTCREIVRYHQGIRVEYVKEIRERNFGCFQGKTVEERAVMIEKAGKTYDEMVKKSGETMEEKNRRVLDFYNKTVKRHPEETVLWVTHGGCIRPILMMLKGIDMKRYFDFFKELKPDNTSVSIIEVDKVRGHSLQLVNCTKHL